jgi:hypothetical protein
MAGPTNQQQPAGATSARTGRDAEDEGGRLNNTKTVLLFLFLMCASAAAGAMLRPVYWQLAGCGTFPPPGDGSQYGPRNQSTSAPPGSGGNPTTLVGR